MKKRHIFLSMLLILSAAFLSSCGKTEPMTEHEIALGTLCEITVYEKEDERAFDGAFALIKEKEKIFDVHDPESELSRLNRSPAGTPVKVSDELFSVIERAMEITKGTGSAFNLAIGPLVDLWGIGSERARVPSEEEIQETLALIDPEDIVLNADDKTVTFLKEGMEIDLGGIAKGYISECVAVYLKESGVDSAIVNLGGNVYAVGGKKDGKPFRVGLRSPEGGTFERVEVRDEAVVTSGAYERFFESEDGKRYHHILSSGTGYPAESDLDSVSIITPDATLGDALSTACFALGSTEGEKICRDHKVSAVFLKKDGSVVKVNL